MPQEKLLKTLRTMQSDINVMTICGIALNKNISAIINLLTSDDASNIELYLLRYHNFATALTTFVDALEAFERHGAELIGEDDNE